MEAIILAGGLGTRLRSVIADVPKPMALVAGEPFLKHLFVYMSRQGVSKVILSVGYKYEVIEEFFGEKYLGIEIVYSIEKEALGTGGAIKKALVSTTESNLLILNGDTFFNVSLNELIKHHHQLAAKMSMSLKPMHDFDRYGAVECAEDGSVTDFHEKKHMQEGLINGGVYVVNKDIFDGFNLPDVFSFEEFLTKEIMQLGISALVFDEYFIDIGIPEDYQRAQADLLNNL